MCLNAEGHDASEDGTGRGTPIIPIQSVQAVRDKKQNGIGIGAPGDEMFTLTGRDQHAIAFTDLRGRGSEVRVNGDVAESLHCAKGISEQQAICFDERNVTSKANRTRMAVRRITPLEAERLQGFPDHYTLVPYRGKPAKDAPRYKALGNSMATNCMRWIGRRIDMVDSLAPPSPT